MIARHARNSIKLLQPVSYVKMVFIWMKMKFVKSATINVKRVILNYNVKLAKY
jgi:hypothetical protein